MTKRKHLSASRRLALFEAARGICCICGCKINGATERWEIQHEIPLALGGADDETNMFPAHYKCHREHTSAKDIPQIAKAKRVHRKHIGAAKAKKKMPYRRFDGTPVWPNGETE